MYSSKSARVLYPWSSDRGSSYYVFHLFQRWVIIEKMLNAASWHFLFYCVCNSLNEWFSNLTFDSPIDPFLWNGVLTAYHFQFTVVSMAFQSVCDENVKGRRSSLAVALCLITVFLRGNALMFTKKSRKIPSRRKSVNLCDFLNL
jgi:hypothetical protein